VFLTSEKEFEVGDRVTVIVFFCNFIFLVSAKSWFRV
jgi:hypothetical protein